MHERWIAFCPSRSHPISVRISRADLSWLACRLPAVSKPSILRMGFFRITCNLLPVEFEIDWEEVRLRRRVIESGQ